MKYRANPILVEAQIITKVLERRADGALQLVLDDTNHVEASLPMLARYVPQVGDYWVVQEDGYTYVNPKEVFERKYTAEKGEE